jgi:hypothetical protein
MRESAQLSLADAAQKLSVSRTVLDRMERGETGVTMPLTTSIMQLYDQFEPNLIELAKRAMEPGWWSDYHVSNLRYLAWETSASSLHEVATTRIPELLRTAPYEQAVLVAATNHLRDQDMVRQRIQDGLSAQSVRNYRFVNQPLLRMHAVITEAALRGVVGNQQVMLTQWLHLAWATSWAAVTFHVLPAAVTPSRLRGFRLLGFTDPDEPAQVYRDRSGSEPRATTDVPVVERTCLQFDQLVAASLSVKDSAAFVQQLIREAGTPALAAVGRGV